MAQTIRHKKRAVIIGLLVVLIIGALLAWVLLRSEAVSKAIFTIDGHSYSEKEVKGIIGYATDGGEPANQVARQAFNYLKRQHVAEEIGIKISDKEVNKRVSELFGAGNKKAKSSQWAKLVAYDDLLIEHINKLANYANVNGYVYVFFFGQQIERGPTYTPPHYGDEKIIARDQAYAKKQSGIYHNQLSNGDLSPKAAFNKLEADARLGWFNKPNSNPSGYFSGSDLVASPGALPTDIVNYLNSSNIQKGLSEVKTGRTPVNTTIRMSDTSDTKDTYYYFVLVQHLDNKQSKHTFNENLQNLSAHFNGFKEANKGNQ